MSRNIRIPVSLTNDEKVVKVNLEQEFDSLEILSLKITNSEAYTRQCSTFGVIAGRVMLNSGYGVQNAKVNVFIPITEADLERPEITELYPFQSVNETYPNGVRYNLLPRIRNEKNPSHRAVGNFPDSSDFSHYPQYVEIMEKYYKYTTTTNESGDYMIFGVPVGQHDIIMDFDLFDTDSFDLTANDLVQQITLNQNIDEISNALNIEENQINPNKVPDFIYKGSNNYEVEVKTNLDEMPNIFHEVKQVTVSPFWGDEDACDIGITRCDFKINFKYTPTAIFFGFLHSAGAGFSIDSDYNFIRPNRFPEIHALDKSLGYETGDIYPFQKMEVVVYRLDDQLNPGSRKRLGVFQGFQYNGIFRISLPMYMDYYITNEFGDIIPTDDTTLGIPTKGYYAFEFYDTDDKWTDRRVAWGGFVNSVIPGVRVPSSTNGDVYLGGWDGTWSGLFEYDLLRRKRKFYTVKTKHKKHAIDNVLSPGDYVAYFPQINPNKSDAYWNFPLSYDNTVSIDEPAIIGSVLVPRVKNIHNANEIINNQTIQTEAIAKTNPSVVLFSDRREIRKKDGDSQTTYEMIVRLKFSFNLITPNTSIKNVSLEWRKNKSGLWTKLVDNTKLKEYEHNFYINKKELKEQISSINYRYVVTDNLDSTTIIELDLIKEVAYSPPNNLDISSKKINGILITPAPTGTTQTTQQQSAKLSLLRPSRIVSETILDPIETFNEEVFDFEIYYGLGVQYLNGLNSGQVFSDLFEGDEFIAPDGRNVFGDTATWNYGDNSSVVFQTSLYALELSKSSGSNANAFGVHKAYNQVVNPYFTFGVFANSVDYDNKKSLFEIEIYDITNELGSLIQNQIYSSYKRGYLSTQTTTNQEFSQTQISIIDDNFAVTSSDNIINENLYNGNFYYFGLWKGANALYDIEKNYYVK